MYSKFMAFGMNTLFKMSEENKEWKERIFNEWGKTKTMPRKMKKKRRKELQLDFSIQQWAEKQLNVFD